MNREYICKVSLKNSMRLLKNLQNTTGDYFFAAPYTLQFAGLRSFSMQVCCRVHPLFLPTPKKLFGAVRILWPNTAGTGWAHLWLCYWCIYMWFQVIPSQQAVGCITRAQPISRFHGRDADREMDGFPRNRQFSVKFREIFAILPVRLYLFSVFSQFLCFWVHLQLLLLR